MYTKFYDNTIVTKFIKQLVAKTEVPFISTWKPGDFAICGMLYLTKDAIWKCLHTGWPENINSSCDAKYAINNYPNPEDRRYFKRISTYVFGKEYFGVTGHYTSKILGYDATTHFYLGQYLRMMRDIFDLDMMPFYNCYANEYISDLLFDEGGVLTIDQDLENPYKILSVPVKFGKTYMISIDSDLPVEVMSIIYGVKGLLPDLTEALNKLMLNNDSVIPTTYKKYQRTQFKQPILYTTPSWHQLKFQPESENESTITDDILDDNTISQFEKYLKLIIKVPKSNKSSVVVIEGDYPVISVPEADNTNNVTWSNKYLNDLTVNSTTVTGEWIRPNAVINSANANAIKKYEYKATAYIYSIPGLLKPDYRIEENFIERFTESIGETERISIIRDKFEFSVKQKYPTAYSYTIDISESALPISADSNKQDPLLLSPLGLLQANDGNIYAFSNRLLEYLLQNAINSLEEFSKNISRVQDYAKSITCLEKNNIKYNGAIVPGVWDLDFLKWILTELMQPMKTTYPKVDLTGYIDKDTEAIISRGQKV